jgi:two-component system, sensor histidine kinase
MKRNRVNKLVVVVEDDSLVLEATESLLRLWGCRVVAAESCGDAMAKLREIDERPDLIVCDYRLRRGPSGIDAIKRLRGASEIPAVLISADPSLPECDNSERNIGGGYRLLHKPVSAATFRAMLVDASVLRPTD